MYKKLKLLTALCVFCAVTMSAAFAQDAAQNEVKKDEPKVQSAKDKKKELKQKACGNKRVVFDASVDKKNHPTPEAPADKALIYVVRTSILGYKIHTKLAVDGEWKGVNRGSNYFFFTLEPGEHYFCSDAENKSTLTLTVEAGKTYYLKQRIEPGAFKAANVLAVISEEEGKKAVKETDLSVFTIKEEKIEN